MITPASTISSATPSARLCSTHSVGVPFLDPAVVGLWGVAMSRLVAARELVGETGSSYSSTKKAVYSSFRSGLVRNNGSRAENAGEYGSSGSAFNDGGEAGVDTGVEGRCGRVCCSVSIFYSID